MVKITDSTAFMLQTEGAINQQELVLQSMCKQLLKSRIFRGFYAKRRYVENVKVYRDIISLHRSERELDEVLRNIIKKLEMHYFLQNDPIWIGITTGSMNCNIVNHPQFLDTYIWAEMNNFAFGQYWFYIKSIRFHSNEIVLKLEVIRPYELDESSNHSYNGASDSSDNQTNETIFNNTEKKQNGLNVEDDVSWEDFRHLLPRWSNIKRNIYLFLKNDINRYTIYEFSRFMIILFISMISSLLFAIQNLGMFTLKLMSELSHLVEALTPLIVILIQINGKIIGGFYILLTMIWKDLVSNRYRESRIPNDQIMSLKLSRRKSNNRKYL